MKVLGGEDHKVLVEVNVTVTDKMRLVLISNLTCSFLSQPASGQQVAALERLSETAATLDARVPGCPAKVDGRRVMRKVFAWPFILTEAAITVLKWIVSILF